MHEERGNTPHDEALSLYANFQLPLPRESSRFSTTYSFYEFIDQELKKEEERDMVILKVRENIIGNLVEELYTRYMERQVIPFTAGCFLQSLKRVMNWHFLPRDPEDTPLNWERDEPLPSVPVDNWSSYCVPAGSYPPKINFSFKSPFEKEEEEEEDLSEADHPKFNETDESGEDVFSDWEPQESNESLRRSASLPDFDDDVNKAFAFDRSPSDSNVKAPSPAKESKAGSSRNHKAYFVSPGSSLQKIKREINQWISPKNFPPVRVNAGLNILPGEKFSGKTCGRKHTSNKKILIRPTKPTFINAKGQEPMRTFAF